MGISSGGPPPTAVIRLRELVENGEPNVERSGASAFVRRGWLSDVILSATFCAGEWGGVELELRSGYLGWGPVVASTPADARVLRRLLPRDVASLVEEWLRGRTPVRARRRGRAAGRPASTIAAELGRARAARDGRAFRVLIGSLEVARLKPARAGGGRAAVLWCGYPRPILLHPLDLDVLVEGLELALPEEAVPVALEVAEAIVAPAARA